MRIKPKIREKIEKAFKDAGLNVKLEWDYSSYGIYTVGSISPIKIENTFCLMAKINVPEQWMELDD